MCKLGLIFSLLFVIGSATVSEARVFVFEEESFAPFLNLRAGVSPMANHPFQWQSVRSYVGDEIDLVYGGEFGVYFRGHGLGVSLGVLVHTFDPVAGGRGFDAGATQLFSVDVEGISYGPQITFDWQFAKNEMYLWKLIVGGGYQFADIESTYSMTAAGQPLVNGQSGFTESYKQAVPFALLAISTEFLMSGTTTVHVTAGYHYSFGKDWEYGEGGENFAGAHGQGEAVLFEDASSKGIDWSYPFVQVGFNFYVDTIR